jgi:hypothetical protein
MFLWNSGLRVRSNKYVGMQYRPFSSPFPTSKQPSYKNVVEYGSTFTNIIWTNCVSKPVSHVDEVLVLKFGWLPTTLINALHFPFTLSWKIKWHHQIPRPVSGCSELLVNKSWVNDTSLSNTVQNVYNIMSLCFVACIHFHDSTEVITDSAEFVTCVVQLFGSLNVYGTFVTGSPYSPNPYQIKVSIWVSRSPVTGPVWPRGFQEV